MKPANIKVKADGTVKVLDFGLAKALAGDAQGPDLSQSPTMTASMGGTREGVILGTAAYMSPEQARGQTLDKRTDIWSFGCVLYEMLTGRTAFGGATLSDTIANVIEREPAWAALPADLPAVFAHALRRCVRKNPRQRVHDVADVRLAMEDAIEPAPTAAIQSAPSPGVGWRLALGVTVGIVVGGIIVGLTVWNATRPEPPRLVRFVLAPDEELPLFMAPVEADAVVSPNGAEIAYLTGSAGVWAEQLHVRSLDQLGPGRLLAEGAVTGPFFSPDGEQVGFREVRPGQPSVMKRVSTQGRPASTIFEFAGRLTGAAWGTDGNIIFTTDVANNPNDWGL